MPAFKLIVILMLLAIIFSLGSGVYYMMRDKGGSKNMVKALTWRIGLSVALFIFLLLAYFLGWVQPHGITE